MGETQRPTGPVVKRWRWRTVGRGAETLKVDLAQFGCAPGLIATAVVRPDGQGYAITINVPRLLLIQRYTRKGVTIVHAKAWCATKIREWARSQLDNKL